VGGVLADWATSEKRCLDKTAWLSPFIIPGYIGWLGGTAGSASDQQSTNDREVAGSRPTKVAYITVLTGNRMGVNCPLWPAATPSSELQEVGV